MDQVAAEGAKRGGRGGRSYADHADYAAHKKGRDRSDSGDRRDRDSSSKTRDEFNAYALAVRKRDRRGRADDPVEPWDRAGGRSRREKDRTYSSHVSFCFSLSFYRGVGRVSFEVVGYVLFQVFCFPSFFRSMLN